MKHNITVGYIAVLVIVTLLSLFAHADSQRVIAWHSYETQQACDMGLRTNDITDCHKVEGTYNTEFLCSPDGKQCWVEQK